MFTLVLETLETQILLNLGQEEICHACVTLRMARRLLYSLPHGVQSSDTCLRGLERLLGERGGGGGDGEIGRRRRRHVCT